MIQIEQSHINSGGFNMPMPKADILVVDDDEINVRVLEPLLLSKGHAVRVVRDGEEALNQIEKKTRPDVS